MKKSLLVITIFILFSGCTPPENIKRAPGEWKQGEEISPDVLAQAQKLPPVIKGCISSTPDYVVTGSETTVSGDEHCFASNGAGGFGPRINIPGLTRVDGMDVADMDGDGDNDFLVCDGISGTVYLYTQAPANVFTPSVAAKGITTGKGGSVFCTNLREADFDEDGLKDFVVGDNRVTNGMYIYRQGPVGNFTQVAPGLDVSWASPTGAPCNCLFGVAAGDVDGDGHQDVMVLGYTGAGAGQLHFYRGNGSGGMAAPVLKFTVTADFPVVKTPTGLGLFDLEGDGDLDAVVGGSADGTHYVYTNDGAGNFTPPPKAAFNVDNFTGIDTYDFDNDGDDDLTLVDWSNRRLVYVENAGGGNLAIPSGVGNVNGPSIGIGAPQLVTTSALALDHFECYETKGKPVGFEEPVYLKDQFGVIGAQLINAVRFCNPVQKTRENKVNSIRNKDHHLTFYRIKPKERFQPQVVNISNQFAKEQRIEVTDPLFLAVPTQKLKPGDHRPPKGLDHFKCYRAKGEPVGVIVDLKDQFHSERRIKVYDPIALCNPTEKKHRDNKTKIENPDAHLMCYKIETRPFETKVKLRNQFGEEGLLVNQADMLCVPTKKSSLFHEPNITQLCGDHDAIDFDGGMVLPGDSGTGLYRHNPDASWPDGRPRRPCGRFVPIDGFLPDTGVSRFRVAYRKDGEAEPPLGTAPGIHTKWILRDRNNIFGFCRANTGNILETDGTPQQWMDASNYLKAKLGDLALTDNCPNSGLLLAVWASHNLTSPENKDGHYVLWLEWEDTGGMLHREPFEHHLQLDNTAPKIADLADGGLRVTLEDGTTPVGACGEAPKGEHKFKVYGQFSDDYYWGYYLRIRGGNPPATIVYPKDATEDPDHNGWHDYYDGSPWTDHIDMTGTTPDGTSVFLREINMKDLGDSFVDCCYVLDLFVHDAAILHNFNNRMVDPISPHRVNKFITFSAAP